MGINMDQVIGNEGLRENFRCQICTNLVQDAVFLRPCQHIFCGPCIRKLGENGALKCPKCATEYKALDDIQPSQIARQVLSGFMISCPREGCKDQIGYDKYQKHFGTEL